MVTHQPQKQAHEKFALVTKGGVSGITQLSFRTSHGTFLSAKSSGKVGTAKKRHDCELFESIPCAGALTGEVSLRTSHGMFLQANPGESKLQQRLSKSLVAHGAEGTPRS